MLHHKIVIANIVLGLLILITVAGAQAVTTANPDVNLSGAVADFGEGSYRLDIDSFDGFPADRVEVAGQSFTVADNTQPFSVTFITAEALGEAVTVTVYSCVEYDDVMMCSAAMSLLPVVKLTFLPVVVRGN